MWDFEHPPMREELGRRYALNAMPPSHCARELEADASDIGLIPIAAYATIPNLRIIPGCTVASKGAIRSLLLVYRQRGGIQAIRTVAADTSSRATFAYVQILFKKFWQVPVSFTQHPPRLDAMLATCDAAILIGDPALIALEQRNARALRTGEQLVYLDLGTAWRETTGLPWISAFWAVRSQAAADSEVRFQIKADFQASRDNGLQHIEDLVDEWIPRIAVPQATIRQYLTENIHYVLDDECLNGVEQFFRMAANLEILPAVPQLRFL